MKIQHIILLLSIALISVGCGGKKAVKPPPPADVRPMSHEVSEVESTSSTETVLRAKGKGAIVEYAITDAKRAAFWFLMHAGSKPLLKTEKEKRMVRAVDEEIYKNVDQYIRNTSPLKSKRKVGDMTEVELVVRIDVAMLKDYLVENDIIASMEDVAEKVGLPSISLVSAEKSADADMAKNVIGEYLTDREFEVNVVEQSGKLSGIVGKLSKLAGSSDPAYAWALEAGSDVYVEVKVSLQSGRVSGVATKKVSVSAKAFETSTARQLAASTGHSSERSSSGYDALTQEAANQVADKIISQIRKKWMKETKKGKTFKLVAFTNDSEGAKVDAGLYNALKGMTKSPVKRIGAGKNTFQYQTRLTDVANSFELLEALQSKYSGPGKITREMESGTMLVVKAGSGNIDIDFD